MDLVFEWGGTKIAVQIERHDGAWEVRLAGRVHRVEARPDPGGRIDLVIDGRPVRAWVARDGDRRFAKAGAGETVTLTRVTTEASSAARSPRGPARLEAAMHGRVAAIPARPGARVGRGDTLVVIEAMKMEIRLTAPFDGTVTAIDCRAGEIVERGRVLATVAPLAAA